ncbi:Hypothetical predicted protein [Paramuricea clavata]|uniref:Uncharacterized protein n=1 Tax=Paramuricea clavata TaxID=317549 RepID=A0A6S7JTM3_PARCT|nr:Hypothetical predicted protein [Paramuricea clavata]
MGLKPSQGELNAALLAVVAHIPNAHLIHGDLIVAARTVEDHDRSGMIYGEDGVKPDPSKVEALVHLTAPTSKEELVSFLCMMQSNSDFIPNFAQRTAKLRELTKGRARFVWSNEHQICFQRLIDAFRKHVLLRYFHMSKPTYVFGDAHMTGLAAMLAQGNSVREAKLVAFASRTTSQAETRYPQLDLET